MSDTTIVEIAETVTQISTKENNVVEVTLAPDTTSISVNNFAIPVNFLDAENVFINAYGSLSATNVRDAIQQLADQDFRTTETPTGSNIEEGDTWYDVDDNQLKVYRETSEGNFEFVPIMIGDDSPDSDTLDAGAF